MDVKTNNRIRNFIANATDTEADCIKFITDPKKFFYDVNILGNIKEIIVVEKPKRQTKEIAAGDVIYSYIGSNLVNRYEIVEVTELCAIAKCGIEFNKFYTDPSNIRSIGDVGDFARFTRLVIGKTEENENYFRRKYVETAIPVNITQEQAVKIVELLKTL